MSRRARPGIAVGENFTPLLERVSSVYFGHWSGQPSLPSLATDPAKTVLKRNSQGREVCTKGVYFATKGRLFRFRIQRIRVVNATILIASRKSMNWTPRSLNRKVPALVGVCFSSAYQRKRSCLFMNKTYGVSAGILLLGLVGIGAPASHAKARFATGEVAAENETSTTAAAAAPATAESSADLRQRIEALKAQLADLNSELAATADAPSQDQGAPAAAPAATPPAAPAPLPTPSMSGPLATGIAHELPAGPFGKIEDYRHSQRYRSVRKQSRLLRRRGARGRQQRPGLHSEDLGLLSILPAGWRL